MAILTINWPNLPKDKPITVPGIAGTMRNGYKYDVENQLPEDLVLGKGLPKNAPVLKFTFEDENEEDEVTEPLDIVENETTVTEDGDQ